MEHSMNGVPAMANGISRCLHVSMTGMEEMQHQYTRLIRPHAARLTESCPDFPSEIDYVPLTRLVVSRARVGASMTVLGHPANQFLVFGAVDRPITLSIGRRHTVIPLGGIDIVPPGVPFTLYVPAGGSRNLLLQVEPGFLEALVAEACHADVTSPLRFGDNGEVHGPGEGRFLELARFAFDELMQDGPLAGNRIHVRRLEELVATALLGARTHNYSGNLQAHIDVVVPRFVRRAEEYIHAHAGEPLTLGDVATAAAISTRTLLRGFQRHLECTPAAYIRTVRLERCRRELQAAVPGDVSVTTVAARWGFHNIGRFARLYRDCFGENPVETLRGVRRR